MSITNEFKDLIEEMDSKVYDYSTLEKFIKKLYHFRDLYYDDKFEKVIEYIQYELQFLSFEFREGKLNPFIKNHDNDVFPDVASFDEEIIQYLKVRYKTTTNFFFKVLYSFILLNLYRSPKCLNLFLEGCVNLVSFFRENFSKNSGIKWYIVKDVLITSCIFCISNNYSFDLIKFELINLIHTDSIEGINYIKEDLINFMLSQKKIFKTDDFEGISKICLNLAKEDIHEQNAIDFLKLGQKIDNKLQTKTCNWNYEIAKLYENLIDRSDDFHLKFTFCRYSINYYKKSKNYSKVEELLSKLEYIQENMNFGEIRVPIDLMPFYCYVEILLSEKILFNNTEMVKDLVENYQFIPKFNKTEEAYNNYQNSTFLSSVSKEYFDSNYNVRKHNDSLRDLTNEEKLKNNIMNFNEDYYNFSLNFTKLYLHELFIFVYENKILSYDSLCHVLLKDYFKGYEKLFNYFQPSIYSYFNQLNLYLLTSYKFSEFILLIQWFQN